MPVQSLSWEDLPGGGHGSLFQYSCLENPLERGVCRATVHWVTKSQTQLKRPSSSSSSAGFYISIGDTMWKMLNFQGNTRGSRNQEAIEKKKKLSKFTQKMGYLAKQFSTLMSLAFLQPYCK